MMVLVIKGERGKEGFKNPADGPSKDASVDGRMSKEGSVGTQA
jgi:hypothetical protein